MNNSNNRDLASTSIIVFCMWAHLILSKIPEGGTFTVHSLQVGTGTQKGQVSCPRAHS